MDTQKQHDTVDWTKAGPLRIRGRLYRTPADVGNPTSDPHNVVHTQEPLWVLDMRPIDALPYCPTGVRVILRPEGGEFEWWTGVITAHGRIEWK